MNRYSTSARNTVFYGWWIVVLGSVILAVGMGILYHGSTVFFLPLKRDLMVSSTAISLIYGAARLEGGVEGPIVGPLIDRFGPRVLIIGGSILAGTGFIVLSTVHSFPAFFLVYVLVISLGYNAGFFHPVSTAANIWFIRRRATCLAILNAAGSVGGMVITPLLSRLVLNYGWRTGALIAGITILLIVPLAALPIHRSPEARGLHPDGRRPEENYTGDLGRVNTLAAEANFTVKEALNTWKYWVLALGITLRIPVTVALTIHFIPLMVWKGMGEAPAAYLVSLFAFSSILIILFMGWVGDRWNKSLLSAIGILPLVLVMLGLVLSQAGVTLYAFPLGLAIAMGTGPLNWSLVGDLFGRHRYATLRGIITVGTGVATFLTPTYAGWIVDRTGSYNLALITFSIMLVAAAALFVRLGTRSSGIR